MNEHKDEGARVAGVEALTPVAPSLSSDFLPKAAPGVAPSAPEPMPWRRMSRAECMQLAMALERALAARRVRNSR